ncbi:helicase [Streptomyces antimycoticus]|uniref:Helicase n=1 Tax=Streptomyces antimycoticus TaxID=68175 RepID=A0A499UBG1_9ACTN|nr:ABC transporter ATP-binding protein [Streptomyces antimycoticus]BBJ37332.1 helicase [Streptomyces antimycoticus]
MKQQLTLLKIYLGPQWRRVAILVVLLFTNIALELLAPLWLARFIDQAVGGMELSVLQGTACVYLAMTVGRQVISGAVSYVSEAVSWTATNGMRVDLTRHCLDLDMSFHKEHTPGELIERIDGDITTLAQFFSSFVFDVLGRLLLCVGILGLTFGVDWRIGLLLAAFGTFAVLVLRRVQGVAVPHLKTLRQVRGELSGFFEERLTSTEDIKANGAVGYVMAKLAGLLDRFEKVNRKATVSSRYSSSVLEVSVALASAAVLVVGAALLQRDLITLGAVYLAYNYTNQLSMTLFRITRQLNQFQAATASIQRVSELYFTRSKVCDGDGEQLPGGGLSVAFDTVSFRYTPERMTLEDVSFEVRPGESLGIVGRTGSGKTTIGRLVFRGYDVHGGHLRVGGVDVRRTRLADLRSRIGVVTQDVQLFHATVRDNLTLFDPSVPDDRIERAVESLGLGEWYRSLPKGLASP